MSGGHQKVDAPRDLPSILRPATSYTAAHAHGRRSVCAPAAAQPRPPRYSTLPLRRGECPRMIAFRRRARFRRQDRLELFQLQNVFLLAHRGLRAEKTLRDGELGRCPNNAQADRFPAVFCDVLRTRMPGACLCVTALPCTWEVSRPLRGLLKAIILGHSGPLHLCIFP